VKKGGFFQVKWLYPFLGSSSLKKQQKMPKVIVIGISNHDE
jgi:hypothetical protein